MDGPTLRSNEVLERNLAALKASSPRAVELIRQARPRTDIVFCTTDDGVPSATMGEGSAAKSMASRRHPVDEARKLAATIDVSNAAAVAVLGFGLGYHVQAIAQRMRLTGVIFIFEPDVSLLRTVLETIDHSAWIRGHNVCLLTDPEDAPAISAAARGVEGLLAIGFKFLQHPADRARLRDSVGRFQERFTEVLKAVRTTVVTTLMQADVTMRNQLMNADRYAMSAGVSDLHGAARGKPAIVVAAGPSLKRNIELLCKPGLRDRFVIIAVQTVLKQLLARGIKPHFVTALDYHEISKRFYEGLTAQDVEGITLVAEAKANPAILGAFPGAIRVPGDRFIDEMLGEDLTREFYGRQPVTELPGGVPHPPEATLMPGATVAHMGYYLARKLGCDPVILMGQDLGFTDGQYYSAGAAIHNVWSGELNAFNSLEMMEWQRIVRGKYLINTAKTEDGVTLPSEPNLVKRTDTLGRPIYTDQQMSTYLAQFEKDFKAASERGLITIDATEGGVAKMFTQPMRLSEAIERYWPTSELKLPMPRPATDAPKRLKRLRERVRSVRQDVWKVGEISRRTKRSLEEMRDHHEDQARVNRLIEQVHTNGSEVDALQPAYGLVQHLNQTGTLKRVREDRKIGLSEELTPLEKQRRQIDRDIMNVGWLADAADQLGTMLDDAIRMLDGGARITRELTPVADVKVAAAKHKIAAIIAVDTDRGGLGTPRSLADPLAGGRTALGWTLARLARCKQLDAVILLGRDADEMRRIAGDVPGLKYDVIGLGRSPFGERPAGIGPARLWARECWRGGLGTMTIYDEACAAPEMLKVMDDRGLDAAVLVGADWCLVDPALVDECVDRYRGQAPGPTAYRVSFCQAPPGLGVCLMDRGMMRDMADRAETAGNFASLGGVLGYMPLAPVSDPIAKPACITVDAPIRDSQRRYIPDSPMRRAAVSQIIQSLGDDFVNAPASRICSAWHDVGEPVPHELILELCTGRRTSGVRGQWLRGPHDTIERPCLTLSLAGRLLNEFAALSPDGVVTLYGAGDPILHPEAARIIRLAKKAGIGAVHLRTDLVCEERAIADVLDSPVDIISVDLMAMSQEAYRRMMGADLFAQARTNLETLISRRSAKSTAAGIPIPWIVPRLTRCDTVYNDIEAFFDHWTLSAGCAVIDPLPMPIAGDRIEPLPLPSLAASRMQGRSITILSDGTVPSGASHDWSGERPIGDTRVEPISTIWRRLVSRAPAQQIEPAPARSDGWVHTGRSRVARFDA